MKHKKTIITAIITITFLSLTLLIKPSIDSIAKLALKKKLSLFKSDLRYEKMEVKWSKIYLSNLSMTKPRSFKAKELIVSLCYSLDNFVKPCNFELVEAELNLKLSSKQKNSKRNLSTKSRSVDSFMKIPIIARDLSVNILDAKSKNIAKLQSVDIDSFSEKGKFKFKLSKINYRSTQISSNINGYLVTDIKGDDLPFEASYSRPGNKEAWRLDGKLSKKLNKLRFKVKNNGIPREWKQFVKGWIPEDSEISSTISGIIKRRQNSSLYFSIENVYRNIDIDNSLLSDKTIRSLPIKLKLLGMFTPKTGRLKLIKSYLETKEPSSRKAIKVDLEVSKKDILNTGLSDPLKLKLSMKKMSCSDFFNVIPEGILAQSKGFSFSGDLAFDLNLSIPFSSTHLLKHKFKPSFSCQFESVPENLSAELIRSHSLNIFSDPSPQQTAFISDGYRSIDEISPLLVHSVVASEDAGYWKHKGVSFPILFSSLKHNLRLKKYAVGGSTISMQLAKNLFLSRDKNISRKVNEIFLSWYLNETFSKNEILEFYLNAIEFGPDIYGISRAADFYFAKEANELNLKEASFLAKILPNPKYYFSNYCSGLNPKFRKKLYSAMSTTMALGMIETDTYSRGVSGELLFTRNKEWMEKYCQQKEVASKKDTTKRL